MRGVKTVLSEAFIIGLVAIVCGYFWFFVMTRSKDKPKDNIPYLPMTINIFLIGFSLHLLFEYSLLNEKWCRMTYF